MDYNYSLMNPSLYDISSSSTESSSSSSDEYYFGPYFFPLYMPYEQKPLDQLPIVVDNGNKFYDLKNAFNYYNNTMVYLRNQLIKAVKTYKEFDIDTDSIVIVPHKSIVLDDYKFPISQKTLDFVELLKSNLLDEKKKLDEVIGYERKYFSSFNRDIDKLKKGIYN